MRVDVQLNDDELALLSGYSRSTSMGIKKPGELQRELLSDMENIEEKRMVSVPEVENASEGSIDEADDVMDDAPVRVRADFLSMLSELAKPDANKAGNDEDEDGYEDDEDGGDGGILPDDDDEEIDGADGVTLPDDDEDEESNGESLPDDDEEDNDDEDDWQGGVLPDDDEEDYQDGVLPDDDEEDLQGIASEEETTGIPLEDEGNSEELPEDEDEGDSELPEDEDDGDSGELPEDEDEYDSGELPEDEVEELSEDEDEGDYELPEDEDEDDYDSEELPADEDEDASGELPEDDVEGVPESTEEHIDSTPSRIAPVVAEKPASPVRRVQKVVRPVSKQSVGRPAGYSTPPASLYDFILSNGGSMLIEDVKKYYPIDEVKKALNLGKIYRFGNKVGV